MTEDDLPAREELARTIDPISWQRFDEWCQKIALSADMVEAHKHLAADWIGWSLRLATRLMNHGYTKRPAAMDKAA